MSVALYPKLGETVLAENGSTIPADGIAVEITNYYRRLLACGRVLTYDPRPDPEGAPTPLPPPTSGGIPVYTSAAALGESYGATAGSISTTTGALTAGDGGGGDWFWDATDTSTPANIGTVVGSSLLGRWKRIFKGFVDVRWFGALGDGVTDDSSAIQAALNAAKSVFIPAGTYLLGSTVLMQDNQDVGGAGKSTVLVAPSGGYAVKFLDTKSANLHDICLTAPAGASGGCRIENSVSGYVIYPVLERVTVLLANTGAQVGIDLYDPNAAGGNIIYYPLISACIVDVSSGRNTAATGIRARGVGTAADRCNGGRILNGRIANVLLGIDLDNCDTWDITGTAFEGIVQDGGGASPSNAGRAIKFGLHTAQCSGRNNRIEATDVAFECLGLACEFDNVGGYSAGEILNTSGAYIHVSGESTLISKNTDNVQFTRRAQFNRSIDLGYFEDTVCTAGTTTYRLRDQSGVEAPFVRITGPVGAFSLGSIFVPTVGDASATPSGTLKYVYNTTNQPLTVKHEDASGIAVERINTLTGADVVVPGPSVLRFIYDANNRGGGTQRWLYMGAA